jgi:hypothetical protein
MSLTTRARKLISKPLTEVLHILFALELVLAYFYLLELFQSNYVILFHGVVWGRVYGLGLIDYGLFPPLVAIALALSLYVYESGSFKTVKPSKLAVYILVILAFVSSLPLAYWIAYMWSPQVSQNYSLIRLSELDAGIFHVYALVYPILILTTLYAWLPLPIGKAFKRSIMLKIRCNKTLNTASDCTPSDNVLIRRLGIVSILLLSVILPIIPYLPSINPEFKPVSVDIRFYSIWLGEMLSRDCWSAVEYAFYGMENGNRPLYLLILYSLTNLGISKDAVLNFETLLASPFFTLAVYYTSKRLSRDSLYALLASLSAVLGFNMTVGMMAGLFAAWTALTPLYICVALTPSLTDGSLKSLMVVLASSIVMLYMHPWTWSLLMAILTLQLALLTLQSLRKGNFKLGKHLPAVLIGNAIADIVKTLTYPSYGGLASSLIAEGLWTLSRLLARFDGRLPRLLQAFFITSSLTYTVRVLCNLI